MCTLTTCTYANSFTPLNVESEHKLNISKTFKIQYFKLHIKYDSYMSMVMDLTENGKRYVSLNWNDKQRICFAVYIDILSMVN